MKREKKIDAMLEFFDSAGIILVDSQLLFEVVITESKVQDAYIHDELLGLKVGLSSQDVEKLLGFFDKIGVIAVDSKSISGVSLENCKFNTDDLYVSKLWT